MFGYVLPDKPNMFVKDFTMYKAFYCGLCKAIGKDCGQCMRLTTNYDVTFLAVLAHAATGEEAGISNETCILNPFRKKSIVRYSPLMRKIVWVNSILAHYKCVDDVEDNRSVAKRMTDACVVRRHYKRARREMPLSDRAVGDGYEQLRALERADCDSPDRAAHPFAQSIEQVGRELLGERCTDEIASILYHMGKWVYLMDAIDDAADDAKHGKYNVFLADGYAFVDRGQLLADKGEQMETVLMSCYRAMCDAFDKVRFERYEGVLTNIIWYGILDRTRDMLRRTEKCKKIRM